MNSLILSFIQLIVVRIAALLMWGLGMYALILLIKALKIYIEKNS